MTPEESLELNFRQSFELPEDAVDFLMNTWDDQFFDDIADGDEVKREDLNKIIYDFFIGFYVNRFFLDNLISLKSQLSTLILKWEASDVAERQGEASVRSFMWRAGYYDLILAVITLVHGHEKALLLSKVVMDFYGENFDEYLEEFADA